MRKSEPFYDPGATYEENFRLGPFGEFGDDSDVPLPKGMPSRFLGHSIDLPFGIPAGPLLNGKYTEAAWKYGYCLATYKTVRGDGYPCHPHPNIIRVRSKHHDIMPGETVLGDPDTDNIDVTSDGITNSFGVPSQQPEYWQGDVRKTLGRQPKGNLLILSFMGTKREGMNPDQFVSDFSRTCRLAKETGAPILEVNFSCPNVGKEGLICMDTDTSAAILEELHSVKGNIPLLVKIGYFPKGQQQILEKLLDAIHVFADGVVAINTIQATVVDSEGRQVLPGSPVRRQSGICGAAIRWAGLEICGRIMEYKTRKGRKDFAVVGVGGVVTADDYFAYMKLGVDAVQSATGAMWNPRLAIDIRNRIQ